MASLMSDFENIGRCIDITILVLVFVSTALILFESFERWRRIILFVLMVIIAGLITVNDVGLGISGHPAGKLLLEDKRTP